MSTDSEALVVSSLDSSEAFADADPLADGDAEPDGFGFAEALEEVEALGLGEGFGFETAVALGLGLGAGGGVYGVTPGLERELEVWNLKATQPPCGTLSPDAPELA